MDDLFPALLVLVVCISSIISKAKKAQASKDAVARHKAATAAYTATVAGQAHSGPASALAKPAVPSPLPVSDISGQTIAPTVHPHIEPDCDIHDIPGSLSVTSMEGKDPCHEDELTLERTFVEPTQAEGGLTFDWSGQNMVKAFVMQEILTRPGQRRAR